ncbi:pilus assembly PilX N-terminal domain-containing protein [Methylophaga sp. OBS4]|uniref:pilus assembly PilX N-terminal domain-containing protein n=1 Tax=Methylophaga sp. OBS4 TaxID=2991935 RepID=UPI00224F2EC3|nr:pilus assembly PilX N-terminal domain-containing protein [Methylophaga sp. OBS4]MCX4187239.1 pilus assembly PilX N-terminal domain-containing protein [Methylophaga sp. OBS4]
MKIKHNPLVKKQQGAVVLVVSVILLIAVTLVVMFATKVGLQDQRISGNQYRHKQAFSHAEAGLDQAAAYLRANPSLHDGNAADGWLDCTGNETKFPCNVTGAVMVLGSLVSGQIVSAVPELDAATNLDFAQAFLIKTADNTIAMGVGTSDDDTGSAIAQVNYAKTSLITPGELPPLMIPSGDLSGNFNIVPNPNGGGAGVAVSVWASTDTNTSGANWKTCDHDQFRDGGSVCMDTKGDGETGAAWGGCSCGDELSNSTNVNSDIVLYPPDEFPSSPFAYVFGDTALEDEAGYVANLKAEVKARAEAEGLLLPNCDNIVSDFAGLTDSALVWVEGDCDIGSNINVGSRDKPIILVVEGDIRVNAGAEFWGIVVGLSNFVLNGGPVIHGSAISDIESDLTNGTYSQVYDESVFQNLTEDSINTGIARMKYSWHDFLQ